MNTEFNKGGYVVDGVPVPLKVHEGEKLFTRDGKVFEFRKGKWYRI